MQVPVSFLLSAGVSGKWYHLQWHQFLLKLNEIFIIQLFLAIHMYCKRLYSGLCVCPLPAHTRFSSVAREEFWAWGRRGPDFSWQTCLSLSVGTHTTACWVDPPVLPFFLSALISSHWVCFWAPLNSDVFECLWKRGVLFHTHQLLFFGFSITKDIIDPPFG